MRTIDSDRLPAQAKLDYHRSPPSFSYKVRELLAYFHAVPDDPRFRVIEKLGAAALLDRIQVPHAQVYGVLRGIGRLTPAHLSRPLVLKPLEGNSAAGVMVLRPARKGPGYFDSLSRRRYDFAEIVERCRGVLARRRLADVWILEERLQAQAGKDAVPDDIKVYTFQGQVELILQRRVVAAPKTRLGHRPVYRWYDARWEPVNTGKHAEVIDATLEPPKDADALVDLARRVSCAVPFAFTRVDTYAAASGLKVGEVNAFVGGYDQFNEEWDYRLGVAWEAAQVRVPARWRPVPASVVTGRYPVRWWHR